MIAIQQLKRTILIVKESQVERSLYRRYLQQETSFTYDLWEAESGEMALQLCDRQIPDCIVLDYLLPDRNGLEVLVRLKTLTGENCPPVIMLNEGGNEAIAIQAFKLGVQDYLIESEITPESFCLVTRTAIENFQLRQQLRESEERYRAIVEDQTELICRFLPDCTLTFVNASYSRYFDSTPEDLIGQNFLNLIPESDRSCVRQQIAELSAATPENGVMTHEHPVIKANGEIGWQQWTNRAIFNTNGELIELQAVGRDISDRKQTEIALQKANERFEIAAAVNCLIYDYDLEQNTIYRSQGLKKLFGYLPSETEPTAEWWYERVHPSQREMIQEVKRAILLGTETSVCLEYQVYHRDGHYIWVQDMAVIVRDESGRALRIIGRTTDISDRKLAEQLLRESKERLRIGVQVAGVGLARFDYASNAVELSPEAAVLYGFSRDDLIVTRDRIHATFHPEERELMEGIIEQVLDPSGNGWFEQEHRVVWQNGEVRWLSVRKQVFFDRSGDSPRPDYGILAAIDITERKQTEAMVQQQLAQIEAIYATAPIGLCFLDRELRFVQMNERLAQINGLPVSEQLGRTIWEILPKLAETQAPIFNEVFQTGLPILDVEVQGTTPAQPEVERHWLVSYYPLRGEDRQVNGINITVLEITDRKQAEEALRQSEQRLQAIINNSKAAIFMKDVQGRYLLMNPECERLFHITNDEIRGKTDYDLFPQEIADALRDNDRQVFEAETALTLEEQIPLEDGIHTYIAVKFTLFDSTGVPYAICGISTDISDRVRLQAEAEAARETAEQANRDKDEFVAVVAHELRSPINAVAGWMQLLRTRQFDQAMINRAYDAIERGTQTQVQLIEDLLDISRIACGTLRLNFVPVNLTLIMRAALSLVRPMADGKQIHLETRLAEIPQVSGDLNRLQQIMVNLFTNAIKFTPEGGQVTITLELVARQARITVRDTGQGISPEFLPNIFEQFQQAQKSSSSRGGLGLGLAIVKNLVEIHNGTITAESPGIGEGATFTVWLPLIQGEQGIRNREQGIGNREQQTEGIESQRTPLAGIRILAVDDEPDSLELLRFILENAGAEVETAPSASVAFEVLTQFNPNLLVSDIAMPDLNGHELLQQIRMIYQDRQIPAIALTAYASSSDRDYALRVGFDKYFSKPIELEVLVQAIVSLVFSS
jgi:PAS domain S-box-containing protein